MSIRDDFFAAQAKASLWDVAVSIKRGNPLPLDANSVFKALGTVGGEDYAGSLLEYAQTNPVAYPGQICAVVGVDATTVYYLDQNLAVQPVGIIPTGDNKTIEVTANGAISLLGAAGAANGTLPMIDAETGKLVWKTLEDIGAGDGNDNTTYEFDFADQVITIVPKFNGQPVMEGEGEEAKQVKYELDLSTFVTETELADAIKDFVTTDTTYSVKEGDKVLKLEGTEFSTVVSLNYVPAVETNEETGVQASPAKIQLLGIGDVVIDEIDATPFIKDGVLHDVDYDSDTKKITFYWNTDAGLKSDTIEIGDLVDTYTAGNGLNLANNEFSVKIDTASENFLTVGEAGLKLAGVAQAIADAEARAASDAESKANAAKAGAIADAAEKYYGKNDVYTKSETDTKIDEKIASVTGGESAADVKLALESYRTALNKEIWGDDAEGWTTSTVDENGKTVVTYTPAYGNKSRVDALEEAVDALEAVGAQANVIEEVKGVEGNRITITTEGKVVTINDANLRTDIADAKKSGTDAQGTANANAQAIAGHDTRISGLEAAKTTQGEAITALQNADVTLGGKITDLEATVNNETSGVAANAAKAAQNASDIVALKATDKTHGEDIAALKETTAGHTTSLQGINAALENIYRKTEVYNTTEIDSKVNTINEALNKKLESTDLADYIKAADVAKDYATIAALAEEAATARAAEAANAKAITDLTNGAVKKNTEDIAAINALLNTVDKEDNITSLKELALWVEEHGKDAAEMAGAITALENKVDTGDKTVATYVNDAIAAIKPYELPVATDTTLGGVISAKDVEVEGGNTEVAKNAVYVSNTGAMTVKKVTTDILANGDEEFVLFGGKA